MALAECKRAVRSQVLVRHYDIFSMGLCRCHGIRAADRGQHCQAAGAIAKGVTAILFPERIKMRLLSGVPPMEKHELSAIDLKLIDDAFKALLQLNPELVTADKIKDLRNMFHDAYTGWLEIDEAG